MAMDAFDLAERFQTLVFVMSDLDLGHEHVDVAAVHVSREGRSIAARCSTRRRCSGWAEWGRYQDVDGDGIPYRTIPGTGMPPYFTRGRGTTSGAVQRAPGRLRQRTWNGWRASSRRRASYVPKPIVDDARTRRSASSATAPATGRSSRAGISSSGRRGSRRPTCGCAPIRSPTSSRRSSTATSASTSSSRTATRRCCSLMRLELSAARDRQAPRSVLHYNGLPIDARSITDEILAQEGMQGASTGRSAARRRAGVGRARATRNRGLMDTAHTDAAKKTNRIGLEIQPYRGGKTTLCAGCGHNAISERIIDAFFEMGIDPRQVIKLSGIGCSSKSPAYFLGDVARLQLRPRPHAVGRDRGGARQPQADRDRRQRRRRHRRDRHRPVRPPDAAQRPDRLHHRRQRLLRAHEGPVLADRRRRFHAQERRRQRPAADRHVRAGDRARRVVRRAFVLGRQKAAAVDPEGVAEPSRHGDDRRHLAVRDVQRSRGLDEELRLRKGSRRAARRGELRAVLRRHQRSSTSRARPRR